MQLAGFILVFVSGVAVAVPQVSPTATTWSTTLATMSPSLDAALSKTTTAPSLSKALAFRDGNCTPAICETRGCSFSKCSFYCSVCPRFVFEPGLNTTALG